MKSQRQISLLGRQKSMIPLKIEENHMLVQLTHLVDWEDLIEIAEEIRKGRIIANTGPDPHYRALIGAVVVRALKSCDLRTAEDLIRNYLPGRYMCDLHNSHWTPDHDTIWEFEQMLGEEGLHRINTVVLHLAEDKGFLNSKSLCSDTTAQEGKIPFPNEVGLMGSFARSMERAIAGLGRKGSAAKEKIVEKVKEIKKLVRHHRLFAKSKEERLKLGRIMAKKVGQIKQELDGYLESLATSNLKGYEKVAARKIQTLREVMETLLPQICFWLETGFVAKNKIISLFQPDLRCIKRGKIGKDIESGLKWGINQIKGGYISLYIMDTMMAQPLAPLALISSVTDSACLAS